MGYIGASAIVFSLITSLRRFDLEHVREVGQSVAKLLDDAAERAEANDRKTVQPRDL